MYPGSLMVHDYLSGSRVATAMTGRMELGSGGRQVKLHDKQENPPQHSRFDLRERSNRIR